MMLRKAIHTVPRIELDVKNYQQLVASQLHAKLYFDPDYLDFLTKKSWLCLVYGNYDAVLPIALCGKGLSRVCMPIGCQTLGILSSNILSERVVSDFYHALKSVSWLGGIYSSYDKLTKWHSVQKVNCTLDLTKSYENIRQRFASSLKRNLIHSNNCGLEFRQVDLNMALEFKIAQSPHLTRQQQRFVRNFIEAPVVKKAFGVWKSDELLASCCILFYNNQIYYFLPAVSAKGRKFHAGVFLIDNIIQMHAKSYDVLDFEGSSLPNIRSFYRKFGSEEQIYYCYSFGWVGLYQSVKRCRFVKRICQ